MTTLTVTSPLTRGKPVKWAQEILARKNILEQDFLQGAVDGQFGEQTGRACVRAKFWLGYPEKELRPTYGATLDKLLTGEAKLPASYKTRRTARLKAKKQKPLGAKAFAALTPHMGLRENPANSNKCLFSAWYGMVGPWCAMCTTWAYVQAGSKALVRGVRYAYVPYIVADARAGRNHLSVTKEPQRGDLVCFDWGRDGLFDHVGLFDQWTDRNARGGGEFKTREGNTSADNHGSQSNGGGLYPRSRSMADARIVFVRVGR